MRGLVESGEGAAWLIIGQGKNCLGIIGLFFFFENIILILWGKYLTKHLREGESLPYCRDVLLTERASVA